MAEYMTVVADADNYEEALQKCFTQMKNLCGQPNAQILRRIEDAVDCVPMIDWLLEHTDTEISLGASRVKVEADFFLIGSDGED